MCFFTPKVKKRPRYEHRKGDEQEWRLHRPRQMGGKSDTKRPDPITQIPPEAVNANGRSTPGRGRDVCHSKGRDPARMSPSQSVSQAAPRSSTSV